MRSFPVYGLNVASARCLVFIMIFTNFNVLSYPQVPDSVKLKSHEQYYSEELLIRTDRDLYISGEKVWLKIYKLNGLTHTPENLSKIVYVEALDVENNPVAQMKIEIDGYSGQAGFRLPDTLKAGNYFLRSYTNWMRNFSDDLYSYKKISVINPFRISDIKVPDADQGADSIIVFPEGGHLVADLENRIGFKFMNKKGEPVKTGGALINAKNDTLCRIQTGGKGFGLTSVSLSGQRNIFLVTTVKDGHTMRFQMPRVQNEGIVLSVPDKKERSSVMVKLRTTRNYSLADSTLFLILNTAGLSGFKKEIHIKRGDEINLLRNDMPEGLSQIMIADKQGKILTFRWIYNEADPSVNYNIHVQNDAHSSREKIKIGITATDNRGNPVESDFSVSVAKAATLNERNLNNINSRQLPGIIADNRDDNVLDINDYLIFYNANELILNEIGKSSGSKPSYLPELEGHLISGNIKDRRTGDPVRKQNISLSFVGKAALCQFAKTNEKGEFNFKTSENGMHDIVIQPLSEEIKEYYVEINNPFTPATKQYNYGPFYLDTARLGGINNVIISMQINNIYEPYAPTASKREIKKEKADFYGKPDNTIFLSNYIELTSLKEVVKEIIPGVNTVRKNDKMNFKLFYQYQSRPFENSPLVLVDGVPVHDLEKVLTINSRDLEKIDVFPTRYYISDIIMDGILHFVTKKGALDVIEMDRSVYRVEYELPENHDEFCSPDYSTDANLNNHIPDFRNTLYWDPEMQTDKTGKAEIEFYSSDESGDYIITVEGVAADGSRGSAIMPLTIKAR